MLTWGILKNVNHVVQRVVFLHEDLMKLPSFPRKALEAELDLYVNGEIGKVSYSGRPSKKFFRVVLHVQTKGFFFTTGYWVLVG